MALKHEAKVSPGAVLVLKLCGQRPRIVYAIRRRERSVLGSDYTRASRTLHDGCVAPVPVGRAFSDYRSIDLCTLSNTIFRIKVALEAPVPRVFVN